MEPRTHPSNMATSQRPQSLVITYLTNEPQSVILEDAVTGQHDLRVCLTEFMEKFVLRDGSHVFEHLNWEAIGEHFSPMIRHQIGVVKASPNNKSSLNWIDGDSHKLHA